MSATIEHTGSITLAILILSFAGMARAASPDALYEAVSTPEMVFSAVANAQGYEEYAAPDITLESECDALAAGDALQDLIYAKHLEAQAAMYELFSCAAEAELIREAIDDVVAYGPGDRVGNCPDLGLIQAGYVRDLDLNDDYEYSMDSTGCGACVSSLNGLDSRIESIQSYAEACRSSQETLLDRLNQAVCTYTYCSPIERCASVHQQIQDSSDTVMDLIDRQVEWGRDHVEQVTATVFGGISA